VLVTALLLAGGAVFGVGGGPDRARAATADALPVLGSTTVTANLGTDDVRATVLVHGVRRIAGGTVLYFSVGLPAGAPQVSWLTLTHRQPDRRYSMIGTSYLGNQLLVDLAGHKVYSVLVDGKQNALASPTEAWPQTAGKFNVLYEVLPALPAGLSTIDVQFGSSDVIHDVPVADGAMEPAVVQTGPLALGSGWPKIDEAAVAASVEPEESIRDLSSEESDVDQHVVKRETSKSVSVDLSADVLFALDSATLAPAATSQVQAAAAEINQRAAGGQVEVVGYTDNSGSVDYNLDLSRRRAQAVAKVLRPLVTVSGLSITTSGKGEDDPVGDNTSASGRQANRRVSVVFVPKADR
jgi:outer membrane protein OmpA-like peptidoglycan-associated protein